MTEFWTHVYKSRTEPELLYIFFESHTCLPDLLLELKTCTIYLGLLHACRQAIEEYCNEFHSLLAKILEVLLSSCLKASGSRKSSELLDGNQLQVFRASHYDVCPQPDMVMGLRSHVDNGLITAIVQDDTGGLQVHKDGQWYGVAPTPGAIVVLMGSVIQVLLRLSFYKLKRIL